MQKKCSSIFGKNFETIWPTERPDHSDFGVKFLSESTGVKKPPKVSLSKIIENSNKFPINFPIETCRIYCQPDDRKPSIEKQVNSAYPIIHERVLWLYLRFLEHKIKYGSKIEKEIYANLSLCDFVQRLLTKRSVTFFCKNDRFLHINGDRGASGFVPIGTLDEKPPLLLRNCLSYDEIKLSALLSVSSFTEFLNDGNRKNVGEIEKNKSLIQRSGVIIGLIGARLSRRDLMEFQDIVISKSQNTIQNGYGPKNTSVSEKADVAKNYDFRKMWNDFYEEEDFLFEAVKKDGQRFGDSRNQHDIFDNIIMKKRYTISFDTLLLDSEARAASASKKAYIHVVGIGLGVWKTAKQQDKIFLETFSQRIKALLPVLNHVAFIHFSWFNLDKWMDLDNGSFFKSESNTNGGIRIFISARNPAQKLEGPEFDNCLVIESYAWDGNALPGNEFWMGLLSSSGDPAAAASTLISEIHNPHINDECVNGRNLHVASEKYGVIHISEFCKAILK